MKQGYDFSKAKRGKLYRPDAKLNLPVYLDDDVRDYLANKAKSKNVEINEIANDLLRKDIEMIEGCEVSTLAISWSYWLLVSSALLRPCKEPKQADYWPQILPNKRTSGR